MGRCVVHRVLAGALLGACLALAPPVRGADPSAAITGIEARLIGQEAALPDGRIAWSTRWRLCWAPVAAAVAYAVTTVSPEGAGPTGITTERCFAMTIASGIAERADPPASRPRQSDPMQALMLSFRIAAQLADGTLGPASPAIPVGRNDPPDPDIGPSRAPPG